MRIRSTPPRTTSRQSLRQLRMSLDGDVLQPLNPSERERATAQLATLLLLAAGVTLKERDDDDQR